jgi:hypothetical protein
VIENYPYVEIDFSRDPDMGVPHGVVRGELGILCFFFFFQIYLIFYVFYIYHFLYIPEYLKIKYVLCADVGPVHPMDFARNRQRP